MPIPTTASFFAYAGRFAAFSTGFRKTARRKFNSWLSPATVVPHDQHEHDFRMLVEAVSDYAVYRLTPDGIVASWNKGAERNKGYTAEEAIGLHVSCFYTQDGCQRAEAAAALEAARHAKYETYGWRVRKDGSRFWAHVIIEAIRTPEGILEGFAKVTRDVTAFKQDRDILVRNLDAALSNMSQGLCLFDSDEQVVLSNTRLAEICSLSDFDIGMGMPFRQFLLAIARQDDPSAQAEATAALWYDQHRHLIQQPGGGDLLMTLATDRVLSIAHRPIGAGSWVTTIEDISERSRSANQVAHMAMHDALTDLPNRVMLLQRLQEALNRVKRGEKCAVLCLDLDRFKTVNDTLGHSVGDALLIRVSDILRGLLRETDTVGRLGGDEFAIIQCGIKKPTDAIDLADRLLRALSQPQEVCGHLVATGISIGIALAPDDGLDVDQLMKSADLALYRAKSGGRGGYCCFEPEMDALLQKRRVLELDLRAALAAREFEIYYQPIIDIEQHTVCAFEALLRWHSPRRGLVSPVDFVPLAEEIGVIVDIGRWVLEAACREAATWPGGIKVAVNVSVAQFEGFGLVEAVQAAIDLSGLEPHRLEIEITESIMIADSQHACEVLRRLKALGPSISMDDFGTGYSSLGYLRSFPFDKIKIDRFFVQGLGDAADCNAIVQAVIGICDSLGITATAEGVETEDQMKLLRSRSCHQAQGFLFSKPAPAGTVPSFLAEFPQRALGRLKSECAAA